MSDLANNLRRHEISYSMGYCNALERALEEFSRFDYGEEDAFTERLKELIALARTQEVHILSKK